MNKHREKFNERKEVLLKLLSTTKNYYEKYSKNHEVNLLETIIKNVNDDEFSIVLVGEFSAGKSTFLNALMGEMLLPSFTNETTATINYLRHKDRAENGEEGRVYFSDGTVKVLDKVDFETISTYVSTESKLGVVNKVDHLDLFLDSKFLEGNITLVDSPGLNGVADGHREVTEAQIEKSNASIFMFKSNQPGSKTDFKFLGDLKSKVNTIIFVLNKIDDIKKSEGETPESVMAKLKESYKKEFPEETAIPEIWGISAYQALVARSNKKLDYRDRDDYSHEEKLGLEEKSRMGVFENRLWQFITQGEKARAMLTSPVEKVIMSLSETKKSIEEEIEALNGKVDSNEIESRILEVTNQIDEINNNIKIISGGINSKLDLVISEVQESLETKLEAVKSNQTNKLHIWNDIEELMDFDKNIEARARNEYEKVIKKCEREFIVGVNNLIADNYSEVAENINSSLNDSSIKVSINTKYQPTELDLKIGIEKYEEEIKKLQMDLKEKEGELASSEQNIIKARLLGRQKDELESKISNVEAQRVAYMGINAPSKECVSQQVYEEYKRKGIFGRIGNVLVGAKRFETTETKVINEDEIVEFKKQKSMKMNEYENRVNELNKQLKSLGTGDKSEEEYEYFRKKIIAEEKKIQDMIMEMQQEFKEKYTKKNQAALNNRKFELENYFDEINSEYSDKIREELYNKKNIYVDLIKTNIANSLNIKLQQKNDEYKMLETKLKSSVEEKNERINQLNAMLEDAIKLIGDAITLQSDIEMEPIDKIIEELI